jgi:Flp pilus assembly pilin Flp
MKSKSAVWRNKTMRTRKNSGQAAVEFALVLPLVMVVLIASVQMALLGQIELALGQANYQGARFASLHPDCDVNGCTGGETAPNDSIKNYVLSVMSPTINSAKLNITATPTAPRGLGSSVVVKLTYDASGNLFLPQNFMGLINFPINLGSTQSAMSQ